MRGSNVVAYERRDERRLKRARRTVYIGVGGVSILALIALTATALLLFPFTPMTIHTYTPSKTSVCPGELISMYIDYDLDENAEVREVEVTSRWEVVDVAGLKPGQRVQEVKDTLGADNIKPGRTVTESTILRSAPPPPGEWRVVSEMLVRGTAYGVPNVQEIEVAADKTTIVKSDC